MTQPRRAHHVNAYCNWHPTHILTVNVSMLTCKLDGPSTCDAIVDALPRCANAASFAAQIAKRQAVVNPENTFFSVKRFIGRKSAEVLDESKQVPYIVSSWQHLGLHPRARERSRYCVCTALASTWIGMHTNTQDLPAGFTGHASASTMLADPASTQLQPSCHPAATTSISLITPSSCISHHVSPPTALLTRQQTRSSTTHPRSLLTATTCRSCSQLTSDAAGNVKIKSGHAGKDFAPEEISALVLRKLTGDATKFLNDKVEKAVITVPAYFNDSQRQVRRSAQRHALW